MKLLFTAVALLLTIITTVQAEPLISQEEILKKVLKSINSEPQHWINTGNYLVYGETLEDVKYLKTVTWPENHDKTKIAIIYRIGHHFNYVNMEKPFEMDLEDPMATKILNEIKIFILKELQADVGHLLKKETPVVEIKPEPKESLAETTSEGDKL